MEKLPLDVQDFLADLELANRKLRTVKNYRYTLGLFFRFCGKTRAVDVTVDDVRRFLRECKRRYKNNTYFMTVWRLRMFFRVRNRLVYDFLKNVKVKLRKTDIQPFSREEILALAREMGKYRGGAHCEKVYYTVALFLPAVGARIGEVCSLNISDVDDGGKDLIRIHFRGEITKNGEARTVYLRRDSLAARALYDYLRWRWPYKPDEPLFVNSRGKRLQPQRVEAKYKQARRILGLKKKCTPHVNRHTFATFLIENNVDPKTVAELTGHKDAKVLFDVYSHISEKRKKAVIKKLQII